MNTPEFRKYAHIIEGYSSDTSGTLPDEFRISTGPKGLSTWYAPFEHVNTDAKLVICGITPGWQQADKALLAAKSALLEGKQESEVLRIAKNTGSFAGVMRTNLIKMLDFIGMDRYLDIPSCEVLFGNRQDLVHYTSALRYPVFKDGVNYSGSSAMTKDPYLWDQSRAYLGDEIDALPGALWLPLGASAVTVFEKLIQSGLIPEDKVLLGMPHASGANAERIKYFIGEKPRNELSIKVNPDILDRGRQRLISKIRKFPIAASHPDQSN